MNDDVEACFAAVPEDRRPLLQRLHRLIVELYPDASIDLSYRMPTYRVDDGWVALADQKQYVSLYTCGEHHIAGFKRKHPKVRTGKGCINLKPRDAVTDDDPAEVVRHAIEHPKSSAGS